MTDRDAATTGLRARYAAVLAPPGALAALTAATVGRISLGMTGLGSLLLVRETTGSYASAGAVSAAYALCVAVAGPWRARTADRVGPRGVLLRCALWHPGALLALVVTALSEAPLLVLLLCAVLAGCTVPPHGAVMRALWGSLVDDDQLATAYSLEAVVIELCFVVGPLLTALLAATAGPAWALGVSGVLAAVGALWLAATPPLRTATPHPERVHSLAGPLASPAVRALLVAVFGIGAGFGAVEVAVPAYVEEQGLRAAVGGLLLALWSLGSLLGGLLYGALHPALPPRRQLPRLVGLLALGTGLPLLASLTVGTPGVVLLAGALVLYGSTIAPFSACNSVLLGASAPTGTVTEAFAWSGSMIFGGAAAGSAAAGVLVEVVSPTAAVGVATLAGGLALAATGLSVRVLDRVAR